MWFASEKGENAVIQMGIYHFDNKSLIVKAWILEMEFTRDELYTVPKWLKFLGLDFKYWSPKRPSKIGKPLMADQHTEKKVGQSFANFLIKVEMDSNLPEKIWFRNERVMYDWRPYLCRHHKKYGHTKVECRKKKATTKIPEVSGKHEKNQKQGDQVAAREKQQIVTQKQHVGEGGCASTVKSLKQENTRG